MMALMRKFSLLLVLAGCTTSCDAFSTTPLVSLDHHHEIRTSLSSNPRRSSSLEGQGGGGGEQERELSSSSSSGRGEFVRAVGAAALTVAALPRATTLPVFAVGVQPGVRSTAPPNALLLVPALRSKLAVKNLLKLLQDPAKWDEAREALKSPPLNPADFKESFRTYSDADPEQHLALDLYRIQAQDALKAVSELLAYLASEKNKGSKIEREDVEDLDEAGRSVIQGIDDFLELAPREDVLMVEKNISDQARNQEVGAKRAASAAVAQKAATAGGRELEGAVVGEGAFVAGAWVGQ